MPWHQFWKRTPQTGELTEPTEPDEVTRPGSAMPPHIQRLVEERKRPERVSPDLQTRLARLEKSRLANMYDIEQGELAITVDNPWHQRMGLLTEAMATVNEDLAKTRQIIPSPFYQLPDTLITAVHVAIEPVAEVEFSIGDDRFAYAEERDWSERGHQLAQSELRQREGNARSLIPDGVSASLTPLLIAHLDESLFVFATDVRDRSIDEAALPVDVTLADMAKPCPVCGGWMDWNGTCQQCRQRDSALQALKREENRLLTERGREAEEQHRLKERSPIARRRLRDIDAEIAQIRSQL